MTTKDKTVLTDISNEDIFVEPTEEELILMSEITDKFRDASDQRNRTYEYLDKRNIIEYIEDSVRRFTTNIDEREDIEDWQARVHDQITRSKVLAVLGKVVSILPIASFKIRGDDDYRKAHILTSLYEYAEDIDDYEEFMIYFLLEAIIKGTAIGYEDIFTKTRKKRNVKGIGSNISVSEYTEKEVTLPAYIVPLEEFYPASVGINNVKKQPYCFWRSEISWVEFKNNWTMYDRNKLVKPFQTTYSKDEHRPYYRDYISETTLDGNVEILRYYDSDNDEYVIIANGIWLNPLTEKKTDKFVTQPLPFNHKQLPFFDVRFDFFGSDFFYGKSLPDRLSAWQDVLNVLTNMTLDQSFLSIFAPILTAGFDDIEDDYLRPGRRIPVETGGLPLNQSVMKLDPGTPSGWHQFILEYTRKVMEEASVDAVTQGMAGQGDRTTAREISVAAEGVTAVLGIFTRMAKSAIKRKAILKGSNIQQAWTDPKYPIIQKVLGQKGVKDINEAFNTFSIRNTVLTEGKRGSKIIEMYRSRKQMPDKETLTAKAKLLEAESGQRIEVVAIPADYIRNFRTDVELVVSPKSEGSKEVEKAIQLEKVQVYLSFFPDMIDREELFATTAEKLGDDPTKIMKKEILFPEQQQEVPNNMDKTMTQNNNTNTSDNMVRGAKGGEASGQLGQLANLQSMITGQ